MPTKLLLLSLKFVFLGLFAFVSVGLSLPSEDASESSDLAFTDGWVDTSDRDLVIDLYNQHFSTVDVAMDWTGSHAACDAGRSSPVLIKQTLDRVNFYRAMAGVDPTIVEEPVYSAKAQHAALAMSAEGELSHSPDESFACLNDYATEAAANSNLYLGRSGSWAIDGYIEDPGEGNLDVGHRSTILHPPTKRMGVGHTAEAESTYVSNILWVFDEDVFAEWPEMREQEKFVAWPPRGYVPAEIVYPRWSFSLLEADFSEATVKMFTDEKEILLEVVERISVQGQVPVPIIVWEPILVDAVDVSYSVHIENVIINGESRTFSYEVDLIG